MAVLEEAVLCAFQQCVYYVSKVRPRPTRGGAAGSSRSLQRGGGTSGNWEGHALFPRVTRPRLQSLSPGLLSLCPTSHPGLSGGQRRGRGVGWPPRGKPRGRWRGRVAVPGCGGRGSALDAPPQHAARVVGSSRPHTLQRPQAWSVVALAQEPQCCTLSSGQSRTQAGPCPWRLHSLLALACALLRPGVPRTVGFCVSLAEQVEGLQDGVRWPRAHVHQLGCH